VKSQRRETPGPVRWPRSFRFLEGFRWFRVIGVLNNSVTMHVGSAQHGARSFPPLAGANHDAGHSGTIVRAIAARILVAGRRVSREFDRAGILQSASSDGAGNFQKTIFLARRKGSASAARHRREAGALEEPEYPQNLPRIYDPPVMLYVRGDATILNSPALSLLGRGGRRCMECRWGNAWVGILRREG